MDYYRRRGDLCDMSHLELFMVDRVVISTVMAKCELSYSCVRSVRLAPAQHASVFCICDRGTLAQLTPRITNVEQLPVRSIEGKYIINVWFVKSAMIVFRARYSAQGSTKSSHM